MIRFEIKRSTVKVFKTEYVSLERDSKGKAKKGTGESTEKNIASFKKNEVIIPENVKEMISKTDCSLLEKALVKAYEDDIKQEVNNQFIASISALCEHEKHLHLIDFDQELCGKIDNIFRIIKKKSRSGSKIKNESSD